MEIEYIRRHAPLDTPNSNSARPAKTTHIHHCLTLPECFYSRYRYQLTVPHRSRYCWHEVSKSSGTQQASTSVEAVVTCQVTCTAGRASVESPNRPAATLSRHLLFGRYMLLLAAKKCQEYMCKGCMQVHPWSHFSCNI